MDYDIENEKGSDETVMAAEEKVSKELVAETEVANNSAEQSAAGEIEVSYDLNNFCLERVLNNNTRNKSIALLGNFADISDSDKAIIIFEKHAFQETDVNTIDKGENGKEEDGNEQVRSDVSSVGEEENKIKPTYFSGNLIVKTEFINSIYGSYQCTPPAELCGVKATVVYPATEKHIQKYSICQKFIINETPQLYEEITLPYITSSQFSLEWVYNILEHKQESERIIFEDPDPTNGFILLPDLKWDGSNVENLYILAITHKRDIKSLRDLNTSHLSVLRNIRNNAAAAIESRYGILSTQLRMYIHYQPSFYHLHVHINPIRNEAPGIWCEKSHMLDTVINNLELLPDYYKKATLPFVLYEGNNLLELYDAKLTVRKSIKCSASLESKNDVENIISDETIVEANDKTMDVNN